MPKKVVQANQKEIAAKQALEAAKEAKAKASRPQPAAVLKPALVTTKPVPPPTKLSSPPPRVGACRHLIAETSKRWALNPRQHFAYCMRIYGSGAGMAEDSVRLREIKFYAGP